MTPRRATAVPSPFRPVPSVPGPARSDGFVGRERERALLHRLRAAAMVQGRELVVVSGDAGIGKSWFCDRVARDAAAEGWVVAQGRCWPHGGAPALWPWPPILEVLLGVAGADLLDGPGRPDPEQLDPERFARFSAVARAIGRHSRPILIGLDDVHWAPRATLLLARFLVGALAHVPVLLLLARRPGPGPSTVLLDELERDATVVALRGFDLAEATAFVARHGDGAPVGPLLRATGGVPMFLARALTYGTGGAGSLAQAVGDALDRLPAPARSVLAAAAVLGAGCVVGEVAMLQNRPTAAVLADLGAARGLVTVTGAEVVLDHDLVRAAAIDRLTPAALLDLHARAAAQLAAGGSPQRVARHALAAAARSDEDAERAVAACRAAAVAARRGYDYESAADLLAAAGDLVARLLGRRRRAEVLVELADAVLACGRLTDARVAFRRAAEAALDTGDPVLRARAELGAGGVWVHEHRGSAERARVLAAQRAALAELPATEIGLRSRLAVRLAAEDTYEGGPVGRVLDALAAAREVGDDRVTAEALSLTHHALLAPDHVEARLAMAHEQIEAASAAGDGVLAVFGLLWRTVDLYELAAPGAERSLAELRERADALGVATAGYIVACMDVMHLIRAGRLADAEAAAGRCLQLGLEVGDADATGYLGAHLVAIRWMQGRDAELADLVVATAQSPTLAVPEQAYAILVGAVFARAGRPAEARAALAAPLAGGIGAVPRSSTWTSALVAAVEAASALHDGGLAAEAAALLEPFADRPVMPSLAVSCLGVAARSLGVAAMLHDDIDAAVGWFERAVAGNERVRHRPAAALCRADLAEALVRRDRVGDRARAVELLDVAAAAAAGMDMPFRSRQWSARSQELAPHDDPVRLTRGPDGWTLDTGTARHALPDLIGLDHLAVLLARPGRAVDAAELVGVVALPDQELLDREALRAYRARLRELDADITDAEADADLGRLPALRREHAAVTDQLRSALGLGGRPRGFGAPPERARTAVRKALMRAVSAISACDAVLGQQLAAALSTGVTCRHDPAPGDRPWSVR